MAHQRYNPQPRKEVRQYSVRTDRGTYAVKIFPSQRVAGNLASVPFEVWLGPRFMDEGHIEAPPQMRLQQLAEECVAWAEAREDIMSMLVEGSTK